jgi:type VI secretion system protein ImpC
MADGPADDAQEDSLLRQMLEDAAAQAGMRSPPKRRASDPLSSLLDSLPSRPTKSNKLTPERLAADIDAWIARQVSEIIAQPEIQRLHLAWQGLKELVDQIDFRQNVVVEFVSCSKQELADNFEAATSVTESGLYRRLCDRELAEHSQFKGLVCAASHST